MNKLKSKLNDPGKAKASEKSALESQAQNQMNMKALV